MNDVRSFLETSVCFVYFFFPSEKGSEIHKRPLPRYKEISMLLEWWILMVTPSQLVKSLSSVYLRNLEIRKPKRRKKRLWLLIAVVSLRYGRFGFFFRAVC